MATQPVIERAVGILMASYALTADEAWKALVCVSQNTDIKLHTLAEQINQSTWLSATDASVRIALRSSLRKIAGR